MLVGLCWWDGRTEYKALCKGFFQIKKTSVESWFSSWLRIATQLLKLNGLWESDPNESGYSLFYQGHGRVFNTSEYCVLVTRVCYFPSVLFLSVWDSWLPMQGVFTTCAISVLLSYSIYSLHFKTLYLYKLSFGRLHPFPTAACYFMCVVFHMMDTTICGRLTLRICNLCLSSLSSDDWRPQPLFFSNTYFRAIHIQKERRREENEGKVTGWARKRTARERERCEIISAKSWDKRLSYSDWLTLCVWVWPAQGSNSDCSPPCEWVWLVPGRDFDWWQLCGTGRSIEPAVYSRGSEWGSRTLLQVRRRRIGMRGPGRWRRSGAVGRRPGTWGG